MSTDFFDRQTRAKIEPEAARAMENKYKNSRPGYFAVITT